MAWIVFTVILIILTGVLTTVVPAAFAEPRLRLLIRGFVAITAPLLFIVVTLLASLHQVPVGHVGLVYRFGDIVDQRGGGLQTTWPWESVRNASVQVETVRYSRDAPLTAASVETQNVYAAVTINYQVSPSDIQGLYTDVGPNYYDNIIEPRLNTALKDTTATYAAVEIVPSRDELAEAIEMRLSAELAQYSIDVVSVEIEDISFDDAFESAILAKQVATQDALRAEEQVRVAEAEGRQRVAAAEADATVAITRAQGEAEAAVARATGESEANLLLSQSLTPEILQIRAIEALADNVTIALIPSGEGIIIDPTGLLQGGVP